MNSFQLYDETRHRTQNKWDAIATNSILWPSKPAQFVREPMDMDIDDEYRRPLSPSSRTEAIVKGQRELMEMVRNMPESNYELSLKDIVEHQHWRDAPQENPEEKEDEEEKKNLRVYKKHGSGRKVDKMAHVKRTGSNIDRGGFYLKVGFPFSFGSKDKKDKKDKNKNNKKKNESSGTSSSKVSPKPSAKGVVDKEWWKKSPSVCKGSKDSESGESSINSESMKSSGSSSSSNSSSSRRSSSRREKRGGRCWYFIRRPKSQTEK